MVWLGPQVSVPLCAPGEQVVYDRAVSGSPKDRTIPAVIITESRRANLAKEMGKQPRINMRREIAGDISSPLLRHIILPHDETQRQDACGIKVIRKLRF